VQPASASDMQPAISLLEKTPRLLETLLGDLPGEILHWKAELYRAHAFHPHSGPFMKYSNPQP